MRTEFNALIHEYREINKLASQWGNRVHGRHFSA